MHVSVDLYGEFQTAEARWAHNTCPKVRGSKPRFAGMCFLSDKNQDLCALARARACMDACAARTRVFFGENVNTGPPDPELSEVALDIDVLKPAPRDYFQLRCSIDLTALLREPGPSPSSREDEKSSPMARAPMAKLP